MTYDVLLMWALGNPRSLLCLRAPHPSAWRASASDFTDKDWARRLDDGLLTQIVNQESLGDPEPKVPSDAEPGRPATVDFSGDSRATAREYAAALFSMTIPTEHRDTLMAVHNGRVVDALALNDALAYVFSANATRFGQSPARREANKKARYLHHIVQAVLANAVDGLPAYETGERSRLVEALKAEHDRLNEQYETTQANFTAVREERDDLRRTLDDIKASLSEAGTILDANTEELSASRAENEALKRTLDFAASLLDATDTSRVNGFYEGFREAQEA